MPYSFLTSHYKERIRSLVLLAALWFTVTISTPAQEFRAAWADVFHAGMSSQSEVNTMVSRLVSGRYNVVIVQVVAYMDNVGGASHGAHYKSSILPWSSRVTASFDPLAYLCQQAHANGIEVHAWLGGSGGSMYRVSTTWPPAGNATLAAHPEWFIAPLANSEGNAIMPVDSQYILDMGSPDAQEYIVSLVRELVTNYPIDGINWDDEINSAGYNSGFGYPAYSQANYPRSGLARFRINTGFVGTPANTDAAWANYRRRYKNELMARVQAEIQSIKTNPRQPVRHTTSPLAYGPAPGSCNFSASTPYLYFSDWAAMLQNGWVDAAIPQHYASSTFTNWANSDASCWQYNRHIFPGIGGYLNTDATISNLIVHTRSLGLKGNAFYSYAVPTSASGSGVGWYANVAANLYTTVVTTPPMPWRNPATATEGIVWGRVKDNLTGLYVDDATVVVTGGPTVKTDGNGYYVATLVPATAAGTAHLVSGSKTGMSPQSTNAIAKAGDIVRADLLLNATPPPPAPTSLTAIAQSLSQIRLAWTDVATNETGFVVARSTVSGGPYVNIANLAANTTVYTNTGLASATTYYYVVRATNAFGTSTNSIQASATTFTNPVPAITTQPQSVTVIVSNSATFSVTATGSAPLSYRWRFNGTVIPGATSSSFTLNTAQYANAGNYSVVVSNSFGSVISSNAALAVLPYLPSVQISNIWNIQAGSRSYVTTGNTERGICINPFTDHVLLVSRAGGLGIFVLNANTGTQVGTMNTAGVSSTATFVLNKIDVADDGVIYGANLTTSSGSSPFIIYRWANEGATATVAYSGAPDGGTTLRWGDSFSVTGAGVNTRILVSGSGATNTFVFTTSNGTNFVANALNPNPNVPIAEFSRGLHLLGANTFYSKNRGANAAKIYNYNIAANSALTTNEIAPLDTNMLAITVITNYNLIAGVIDDNSVNNSGHSVKVYDISSPASPVVVSNFNFLTFGSGTNSSNSNFAAGIDSDGTRIVALDTQNGIVALKIIPNNPPPMINSLTVILPDQRHFELNADPGNFVMQGSSDFINWIDLPVTRTNGIFRVIDPVTNSPRFYRTKN